MIFSSNDNPLHFSFVSFSYLNLTAKRLLSSAIFSVRVNEDLAKNKNVLFITVDCTLCSFLEVGLLGSNQQCWRQTCSKTDWFNCCWFSHQIIQNDDSLVVSVSSAQTYVERDANCCIKFRIFCQIHNSLSKNLILLIFFCFDTSPR